MRKYLSPCRYFVRPLWQLSDTDESLDHNKGPSKHERQPTDKDWDTTYDVLPTHTFSIHLPIPDAVQRLIILGEAIENYPKPATEANLKG